MKRINGVLEKFLINLGAILFAIFIVAILLQVIARNYFKVSFFWVQEVALLTFIWSVFLGGAVAVRQRRHYVVELFARDKFPKLNVALDIFAGTATFILIYVFIYSGWVFTVMGLTRMSRALMIPMALFFLPFPVSGVFIALFNIENLMEDIKKYLRLRQGRDRDEPASLVDG